MDNPDDEKQQKERVAQIKRMEAEEHERILAECHRAIEELQWKKERDRSPLEMFELLC